MSKSSLSSVVSNLVRASMGASVPTSVPDEDLDRHVADLILMEAKQKAENYTKLGVQAYLPTGPDLNAPRANKRFLSSIIRRTDDHNKSILREQALAAQEIKRAREEEERRERRARAEEAASAERSRRRSGQRDSGDWRWDGRKTKEKRDIKDWSSDWRKQEGGDSEDEHGRHRRERRRRRRREHGDSEDEYRRERVEGRRSRRRRDNDDDEDGIDKHGRDEEPRRRRHRSRSQRRRRKKTRRHTPSVDRDSRDGESHRNEHRSEKHRHHNDKELEYRRQRRRESSHPHSPSPAGSLDGNISSTRAHSPSPKLPPQVTLNSCEIPLDSTQGNTTSLSSSPETPLDDQPIGVRRTAKGKEKEIGLTNCFASRPSSSPPLPPPQPSPPPRRKRGLPSSSTSVRSPSVSPPPLPPTALPSKMDKYFEDSYDPRLDVSSLAVPSVPKTGLIDDADYAGWDAMLEFLRQRREDKEEKKRLEKLGFPSREINLEHLKKRKLGDSSGGDSLMGIEYKKRGSVREWDLGKEGV
ncbi:hypothetical protein EDD15DRAFT_2408491 [Pisolithus albus]|nr:hypothetical protein EDD15DRAFT_2408491 [Pisolithus albus]